MIPAGPDPTRSGPGTQGGFRLPRSSRLHGDRDIRELLRRGKRWKTSHLDVFYRPSPVARPRFGVVVPKHRRRIVDRNRLRRRLREVGRIEVLPRLRNARAGLDVLVRARPEAYEARFAQLTAQVVEATESICSRHSSSG